jgi:hypothetical protein
MVRGIGLQRGLPLISIKPVRRKIQARTVNPVQDITTVLRTPSVSTPVGASHSKRLTLNSGRSRHRRAMRSQAMVISLRNLILRAKVTLPQPMVA